MFSNLLQIFLSHLGSFVGVFCLALALNPAPQQTVSKRTPYLNTSVCLAAVPATAVVDEQRNKVAVGWPSLMPAALPATASYFQIGATIPTTSDDLPPSQSVALQGAVAVEINERPGGLYYCRFANWRPPCYYHSFSPSDFGMCWVMDGFDDFFALGPDYDTVVDLYWDKRCKKLAMNDVVYPGFANLSRIGLDKKAKSIYVKRRDQIGQVV